MRKTWHDFPVASVYSITNWSNECPFDWTGGFYLSNAVCTELSIVGALRLPHVNQMNIKVRSSSTAFYLKRARFTRCIFKVAHSQSVVELDAIERRSSEWRFCWFSGRAFRVSPLKLKLGSRSSRWRWGCDGSTFVVVDVFLGRFIKCY